MPKPRREICEKGHNDWYVSPSGKNRYCRTCIKATKSYDYWSNVEKNKERQREYKRHLKMEVILAYGGRCACCGEWRYEFLSIDHINNDGAEHRRQFGGRGVAKSIYPWLKKSGYPEGFQVLCMNCNCAKAWYGSCVHELEQEVRNLMEAV